LKAGYTREQKESQVSYSNQFEYEDPFEHLTPKGLCFECGRKISSAYVRYDGHVQPGVVKSIFMHPACAAVVGQRLISDGYPNRYKQ
jgi:hypothetical protein